LFSNRLIGWHGWFGCRQCGLLDRGDAIEVAADAEAAEAFIAPLNVEDRQTGHLDRQSFAGIARRPGRYDAAEGFVRLNRARHFAAWIKLKCTGDFLPRAAE
jgi:hypothetical protein